MKMKTNKSGAVQLLWIGVIIALGAWLMSFFKTDKNGASPFNNLKDGVNDMATSVGDSLSGVSDGIQDFMGNHHKTPQYQTAIKLHHQKWDRQLKASKGVQTITVDEAKRRCKSIHSALNEYFIDDWEVEEILSYLMQSGCPKSHLEYLREQQGKWASNVALNRWFLTRKDWILMMKYFGLAQVDGSDVDLVAKLQSLLPELNTVVKVMQTNYRGSSKNPYTLLLTKAKSATKVQNLDIYKNHLEIIELMT